jgi:hypothetical protein
LRDCPSLTEVILPSDGELELTIQNGAFARSRWVKARWSGSNLPYTDSARLIRG